MAVPAGGRERAGSRHAEAAPVGAAAVAAVAAIAAVHRVVTHASSEARVSSAARGAAVRLEAVARVLFPTAGFRRERPRRVETRRVEPGDANRI